MSPTTTRTVLGRQHELVRRVQACVRGHLVRACYDSVLMWTRPWHSILKAGEAVVFSTLVSPVRDHPTFPSRVANRVSHPRRQFVVYTTLDRVLFVDAHTWKLFDVVSWDPSKDTCQLLDGDIIMMHLDARNPRHCSSRSVDLLFKGFIEEHNRHMPALLARRHSTMYLLSRTRLLRDAVSPVVKQGFLVKRAIVSKKNWRKRWFVVHRSRLSWFKGSQHKGTIVLSPSTTIRPSYDSRKHALDIAFTVNHESNLLRVQAASLRDMNDWMHCLLSVSASLNRHTHKNQLNHSCGKLIHAPWNFTDVDGFPDSGNESTLESSTTPTPALKRNIFSFPDLVHTDRMGSLRRSFSFVSTAKRPKNNLFEFLDHHGTAQSARETAVSNAVKMYFRSAEMQQQICQDQSLSTFTFDTLLRSVKTLELLDLAHAVLEASDGSEGVAQNRIDGTKAGQPEIWDEHHRVGFGQKNVQVGYHAPLRAVGLHPGNSVLDDDDLDSEGSDACPFLDVSDDEEEEDTCLSTEAPLQPHQQTDEYSGSPLQTGGFCGEKALHLKLTNDVHFSKPTLSSSRKRRRNPTPQRNFKV